MRCLNWHGCSRPGTAELVRKVKENSVSGICIQSIKALSRFEEVFFGLLLWTSQLYGTNVVERRGGWKGLLVAPDTVFCLCHALPEPRHADLYSEHPPNKCQSTKGGNERSALGILSYTKNGTAFVCLFKVELTSLGSWPRATCDHAVLKLNFSTYRRNVQHKSIEKAESCTNLDPLQC